MYIGDTSTRGMHHLVYEIVDNSIDEAMAGFCKQITVRVTADDGIVVIDDGRGIPTGINKEQGVSGVTVAMTKLHAGGKFKKDVYKVSGGLHGVGASVVNALSEVCEVEVYQNGHVHFQAFQRGEALAPLETRGKTDRTGTKTFFKPDRQIFGDQKFDASILTARFRELAFLNRGVSIRFVDERSDPPTEEQFRYEGGIREFVERLNRGRSKLHEGVIYVEREEERRRRRGRGAIPRWIHRDDPVLRQQHPHDRRRYARQRVQVCADHAPWPTTRSARTCSSPTTSPAATTSARGSPP